MVTLCREIHAALEIMVKQLSTEPSTGYGRIHIPVTGSVKNIADTTSKSLLTFWCHDQAMLRDCVCKLREARRKEEGNAWPGRFQERGRHGALSDRFLPFPEHLRKRERDVYTFSGAICESISLIGQHFLLISF